MRYSTRVRVLLAVVALVVLGGVGYVGILAQSTYSRLPAPGAVGGPALFSAPSGGSTTTIIGGSEWGKYAGDFKFPEIPKLISYSDLTSQTVVWPAGTPAANYVEGTPLTFTARLFDNDSVFNGSRLTAPTTGSYQITLSGITAAYSTTVSGQTWLIRVYKNGTTLLGTTTESITVSLDVGDYVELIPAFKNNSTAASTATFSDPSAGYARLSAYMPSIDDNVVWVTGAPVQTVSVPATDTRVTGSKVAFSNKIQDPRNEVDGTRFTAATDGFYAFNVRLTKPNGCQSQNMASDSNNTSSSPITMAVYKNGVLAGYLLAGESQRSLDSLQGVWMEGTTVTVSTEFKLKAGDYIEFAPTLRSGYYSGSYRAQTCTFGANNTDNYMTVTRDVRKPLPGITLNAVSRFSSGKVYPTPGCPMGWMPAGSSEAIKADPSNHYWNTTYSRRSCYHSTRQCEIVQQFASGTCRSDSVSWRDASENGGIGVTYCIQCY